MFNEMLAMSAGGGGDEGKFSYSSVISLLASSTKIRDVLSITMEENATLLRIDLSCKTDVSNNDGYVQVYVNNNLVYTPSERLTTNTVMSLSLNLNVNVNKNDVVTIKTNWDNSSTHGGVSWYFYKIRYNFR